MLTSIAKSDAFLGSRVRLTFRTASPDQMLSYQVETQRRRVVPGTSSRSPSPTKPDPVVRGSDRTERSRADQAHSRFRA